MILDTFADRHNGFVFVTNAAGAKSDTQIANEARRQHELGRGLDRRDQARRGRLVGRIGSRSRRCVSSAAPTASGA